jgi:hypothetical protein
MLTSCGRSGKDITGAYTTKLDGDIFLIHLIKSDDGKITGRAEMAVVSNKGDGELTVRSYDLVGTTDGSQISLKSGSEDSDFGAYFLKSLDKSYSGEIKGNKLTVVGSRGQILLKRSSIDTYTKQKARLAAYAERTKVILIEREGNKFTMRAPDGKMYTVNTPEGTDEAYASAYLASMVPAKEEKRKPLEAGFNKLVSDVSVGLPYGMHKLMAPATLDGETARDYKQKLADAAYEREQLLPGGAASFDQLTSGQADLGQFLGENLAYSMPANAIFLFIVLLLWWLGWGEVINRLFKLKAPNVTLDNI